MLEQRDLDLMRSDAQIVFEEVIEEFNKAFLGGRYGTNNIAETGLVEQSANGADYQQEPTGGGNVQPEPVSGQPEPGGF